MKHIKMLSILGLAALQAACAQAHSYKPTPHHGEAHHAQTHFPSYLPAPSTQVQSAVGHSASLSVIDSASRQPLPIYQHAGEYWVAGTPGQRYELQLTSRIHDRRVLATTSVDGINVISGQTAAPVGRGYVLSPYQTSAVQGWRKSEHEVASFNFAAPQASYAAQTGRPANVGVIGVALFPEALPPPRPPVPVPLPAPISRGSDSAPAAGKLELPKDGFAKRPSGADSPSGEVKSAPAAVPSPAMPAATAKNSAIADRSSAALPESTLRSATNSVPQGLGTQHGQRVSAYAPTVAFQRESNAPREMIALRYDTVENLVARGVLQWHAPYPQPAPSPRPFPAHGGFVPDPIRVR